MFYTWKLRERNPTNGLSFSSLLILNRPAKTWSLFSATYSSAQSLGSFFLRYCILASFSIYSRWATSESIKVHLFFLQRNTVASCNIQIYRPKKLLTRFKNESTTISIWLKEAQTKFRLNFGTKIEIKSTSDPVCYLHGVHG